MNSINSMNSLHVKASIACYFRYIRQYPIVTFERSLGYCSNPDILAVTKDRKLIEAEVKVSISDMKNDAKKRVWLMRTKLPDLYPMPYQFYYAIPYTMKDKALELLEQWKINDKIYGNTGLIGIIDKPNIGFKDAEVIKKAPLNKNAPKLTIKQVIEMVKHQSGSLCSAMTLLAREQSPNKNIIDIDYYI